MAAFLPITNLKKRHNFWLLLKKNAKKSQENLSRI
jgi:hypothetical protein